MNKFLAILLVFGLFLSGCLQEHGGRPVARTNKVDLTDPDIMGEAKLALEEGAGITCCEPNLEESYVDVGAKEVDHMGTLEFRDLYHYRFDCYIEEIYVVCEHMDHTGADFLAGTHCYLRAGGNVPRVNESYGDCINRTTNSGIGLASCNGVDPELDLGTPAYICMADAVDSGARDCEALSDSRLHWKCLRRLGRGIVSAEECEKISDEDYLEKCFFDFATLPEHCEKIPYASRFLRDRCFDNLAELLGDCTVIPDTSARETCISDSARVPEDCEALTDIDDVSWCIYNIATLPEHCEKIPEGTWKREDCFYKVWKENAVVPEDCEKIPEGTWDREDCFDQFSEENESVN